MPSAALKKKLVIVTVRGQFAVVLAPMVTQSLFLCMDCVRRYYTISAT